MAAKSKQNICIIILTLTSFVILSHHIYHYAHQSPISPDFVFLPPLYPTSQLKISSESILIPISSDIVSPPPLNLRIPSESILIPDWEVLVIVPYEMNLIPLLNNNNIFCIYPNNAKIRAKFSGYLSYNNGFAFKCEFPVSCRRKLPFFQPHLVQIEGRENDVVYDHQFPAKQLLRWNFIVYDSYTTADDVVLFVKGINNRQGVNRAPSDFRCVFGDDILTAVRTPVSSSIQEVFRCPRPEINGSRPIKVSIEILERDQKVVVMPSVAKYVADVKGTIMKEETKSLLCACTMVYNVGKFLREWVMFHSKIGVEKFILYDNDSNDDLHAQVHGLKYDGFDVRIVYWVWPKSQEAGFSHCALYASRLCDWAAYVDIDEFFFSSMWLESPQAKPHMLRSLLPSDANLERVGQVSIRCNEFGPSNQTEHPIEGVTQGYTCRRRMDQRHKSIVYLPSVDHSLLNVVHHFKIKDGYNTLQIDTNQAIVNHYKYQAWPEFKAKFRRRVSAYVIDWQKNLNPLSNDRAPGLGFEPVEPNGWPQMFCEVIDVRMKELIRMWFAGNKSTMAW
ncbi:unnamed protein product [Amaranthus hypochondriacus]